MGLGFDFRPGKGRPGALLPPSAGREATVSFVIAVLFFLAALTAVAALGANRAAAGWRAEVLGSASVLVRPTGAESPDTAAVRAAEALAGVPGVDEAALLSRQEAEALLQPWLGKEVLADLPIPRLVAVELDPAKPATADALRAALSAAGVDGQVDDHSLWSGQIVRGGQIARLAAAICALLLTLAAAAVVLMGARSALERSHTVIEVLHYAGAEDRMILGLVSRRFALQAFLGGLAGATAAAGVGALLKAAGGPEGFAFILPLAWSDLLIVLTAPLLAALVGALASRAAAARLLRRYP